MKKTKISILCFLAFIFNLAGFSQDTFPVNGVTDERKTTFVFTGLKIFSDYKTVLDSATLIVRDGLIVAVGNNIPVPKDAVVFSLSGKWLYPSFIDLDSDYGMPETGKKDRPERGPQFLSEKKGAYAWNEAVHPESAAHLVFSADPKVSVELRKNGFGAVVSHMHDGIFRGTGALVLTADKNENELIIQKESSAHLSFRKGSSTQDYPSSLMGSIALIRQTFLDAEWYKTGGKTRETNLSLEALNSQLGFPLIFEGPGRHNILRATSIAKEFGLNFICIGDGDEYQRLTDLKKVNPALIIPLNFPAPFETEDPFSALQVSLQDMKHWELAPYNPGFLEKEGMAFCLTSRGLNDKSDFLKNIRKAVQCGLSESTALKALTFTPAEWMKVSGKLGAVKKGFIASFFISNGNIFSKETSILEHWVGGTPYRIQDLGAPDLRGNYKLTIGKEPPLTMKISGDFPGKSCTVLSDTLKSKAAIGFRDREFFMGFEKPGKAPQPFYRLTGGRQHNGNLTGNGQTADGQWVTWIAEYEGMALPETKKDSTPVKAEPGIVWYPSKAYGFTQVPVQKSVWIKNATIWTNEQEGILKEADLLIHQGKILAVGKKLDQHPAFKTAGDGKNWEVVDGTGRHVTSGIIDEHSHIAISAGVNEGSQSVTSEVRIADVVNPDDVNIYRQLAGGVTASHLLHGSANAIGGQTQLIKLRWGSGAEAMKVENWPGFIKFALGENVKQSNWGDRQTVRFPQTRMGVEQVYIDAFTRAVEYENEWKKYQLVGQKSGMPLPRKDLELEALVEILNEKRFITCHSYQQGEINMLMHVADSFGFKVNTFTHILEGYKVADKMKKHGVAASSFADWWAYKFEVIEAIPHNGSILNEVGVVTGFNSDDAEMARRLNQEAAKAVKYGKTSEEDALKFVTLNPAKMLKVDHRMGSLKAGKDADLVVWNDHPLSVYAKPLKTFVDGKLYFDLEEDQAKRESIRKERARLIAAMQASKKSGEKTQKSASTEQELYHCETLLESYE